MSAAPASVLVVVSYYDARPPAELEALLQDLLTIPAGWPFLVLVVVNQEGPEPTAVTTALPGLRVLHRRNHGYNIGAWDHGWRAETGHDLYLFLQHECRVRRPGWLRPFVQRLQNPAVGLVGERTNPTWDATWAALERRFAGHTLPGHQVDGVPSERLAAYRHFFARHQIAPGERGDHLQTLVLAASGATLRRIDGFPIGNDYGEAIAAEIATSKRVQALGLSTEEIGPRPFTWFSHPQWDEKAQRQPLRPPALGLSRWLEQVRERGLFGDRPWLVLGKGPTFALLTEQHRATHHLFGLNHVVREVPLDLAHAIDIDVVLSCREGLADRCRFLLMPRQPHVDSRAGDQLLEQYFEAVPELYELERQGRLVWYNCSTGQAFPGSPVVEVQCFSSEAAFGILAAMGARTIRSLGIDGGRGYSGSFADLADTTRLANGQPLFDLQFARLQAIVGKHGLDYAPLAAPLHVCIVTTDATQLAAKVLEFTLRKHTTFPVQFSTVRRNDEVPAGAICFEAAALAHGDVAELRKATAGTTPKWLQRFAGETPWQTPDAAPANTWVDAFAEAVSAGVVQARDVTRAISKGHASQLLRQLPAPPLPPGADAAEHLAHRASCLRRELANLRLSLTFRIGRFLLRPAVMVQRAWSRRTR